MSRKSICLLSFVLLLGLTPMASAGLVGHWKLDEGTGTTARDSSGNGYDGTLQGSPQWVTGVIGGALRFSGANSVNCGSAPKAALTQTVSITCWVNPGDLTGDRAFVSRSGAGIGYAFKSNSTHLRFTTPTVLDYDGNNSILKLNTWQHVAVTVTANKAQGCTFYINGVATDTITSTSIPAGAASVEIGHNHWDQWCLGMIDDVRIYDHILTLKEVTDAMRGVGREMAKDPVPADGATDVPRDAGLGWTAGEYPSTHDVYLGTTLADVNNATRTDTTGILASKGQDDTTFDPAGSLAYGQTYYWRIDEVNKSADGTISKGAVWSFTAEPYGYPITGVTATASTSAANMGPEKTVDSSGLTGDLHGTDGTTMWMSGGAKPNWIQYQFDKVYKLNDLKVWNSNQLIESFLGFGAKKVTIEYSADGTTWTALANVPEFAKATGLAGYAANTTVSLGGVMAKYVKLTINSNWGGMAPQTGLSEVRFSQVPVLARTPQPANAATGVKIDTTLNWRPGREAGSHKVYFGADQAAVTNGTVAAQTAADHSFTPNSLNFGTTYYWRVDEVNTVTYPGDVWSFTTQEYSAVDDFESYNDTDARIYEAWIDGWTNGSGSVVGYLQAPFAEQTIIHGGKQSMPFEYNNVKTPYYSETQRTFDTPLDWTVSGASTLSLWFKGNLAKLVQPVAGQYDVSSNSGDVWGTSDNFRFVYKTLTGDGSISAKVIAVTGTTSNWAKAGVMIRNTLDPSSGYAFMFPTPDGRRAFQNRPATGGNAVSAHSGTGVITFPFWVKVERKGNQLTASYSTDGKTWTVQPATENTGADRSPNPQTITMASNVCLGMAVTSNNAAAAPCVGQFSDVVTTGSVSSQWVVADVGPNPANDPASLYVTVEDKAGKTKTVVNPNPSASATAAWTEWRIPLSDLTGISLTTVKKITIGVGDKASPKAGGAGMLYIDDIGYGHPVK